MNNHSNKPGLYRARNSAFLGVCQGIAHWRDLPVFWIRFLVIAIALVTSIWPVFIAYIIIGLMLKPEPVLPLENIEEKEFYDSYTESRKQALSRLKNLFSQLEKRTQRIETIITSPEFDWNRRYGSK